MTAAAAATTVTTSTKDNDTTESAKPLHKIICCDRQRFWTFIPRRTCSLYL